MTEEDEAFEDLAKRQGDWGLQGSRKHQILRFTENVESKGTSMTQDEIIEMAQECRLIGMRPHLDGIYSEALVAFAKLVAEKTLAEHAMRETQRLGQEIEATKRKWVDLTDDEIDRVTDAQWGKNVNKPIYAAHRAYARAVEAASKGKNT